jgi:hypothetical protein
MQAAAGVAQTQAPAHLAEPVVVVTAAHQMLQAYRVLLIQAAVAVAVVTVLVVMVVMAVQA